MSDPFQNIVGQQKAKNKLGFFLKSYESCRIVPHVMLVSPKGFGKTSIARAFGKGLKQSDSPKAKSFIEVNCSTVKGLGQFLNELIIPKVADQEVTVLLDECSELPRDVEMALLSILNPNKNNRNSFTYEDYTIDIDFSRQTFIFATTESHQVFHALLDRLERVDLETYKSSELAAILRRHLGDDHQVDDGVIANLVDTFRGSARQAAKMANKVKAFLEVSKKKVLDASLWDEFAGALDIVPLGLTNTEINYLRILTRQPKTTLTHMSACTGMSRSSLQQDVELHLLSNDLIRIDVGGRVITPKGSAVLRQITS